MMEIKAWDAIGWDYGTFRIKGGRATYEAVMYNCHNEGKLVKLARLELNPLREVSRYVEPDTLLIFDNEESSDFKEYFLKKICTESPTDEHKFTENINETIICEHCGKPLLT